MRSFASNSPEPSDATRTINKTKAARLRGRAPGRQACGANGNPPETETGDRALRDACLLNDDVGLEGAGGLDGLEYGNDACRLQADLIEPPDQGLQIRAPQNRELSSLLIDGNSRLACHDGTTR